MKWKLLLACAALGISSLAGSEPAAAAAGSAPSPEALIAELDGLVRPRPGGGWIQLKMEGVSLAVYFYNEKAEAVAPDVDRALARFVFPGREDQRRVLVPMGEGRRLTHGQPVRPPHVFKLLLAFFRGESSEAVESYDIDFK